MLSQNRFCDITDITKSNVISQKSICDINKQRRICEIESVMPLNDFVISENRINGITNHAHFVISLNRL